MKRLQNAPQNLLRELLAINQELETRRQENKAVSYIPNGKCEEFIKLVGSNSCFTNLFIAANGVGKCLPLDTPILMADGKFKQLKDVKRGDWVIGHDYNGTKLAEPTKVLGTSRAGIKKVYKISLKDGTSVFASGEHSFPVKLSSSRDRLIKKVRIDELLKRKVNYVGGKIKLQQPARTIFKSQDKLSIDPYLLGVLLGDGGLTSGGVRFTNTNKSIIKRVNDIVFRDYNCVLKQGKKDKITYRITQRENLGGRIHQKNLLIEEFRKLGLMGTNSGNKFIPHQYKIASIQEREQLICGLIDTDGTNKEYLTKSEKLADDFVFIVRSLGGLANKKKKIVNNSFTKRGNSLFYRIYWAFDYRLPLLISRKQIISKKPIEYTNRFVEKIEFYNEQECGDIWVEHPSHTYLSHDFISTGNTAALINIITNICFGPQNDWFKYPLFENFPYLKRGRIISDPTTIKEKIIPELKKWFPSNRYKEHYITEKQGKFWEAKWTTDTGFTFDILSNEQESKEFESVDLGWLAIDEPIRKDIYMASVARSRMGCIIFWTMTPLDYSAWIEEDLYNKRDGINVEYIEADIEENCKEHSARGLLEHKNIERMIAQYPEDERQARIHGKFGHLLGKIIKAFNRKIHIIRPFEMKYDDYAWFMALDTHPQVDDHALWMAINNKQQKYLVAEYVGKGTASQLASEFKRIEGGMRIEGRLIDPSAFDSDERNQEPSFGIRLKEFGFMFELGSKDLVNGIRRTQDAFAYEMVGNEFIKKPEVFIFDTCPVAIHQIESYVWVRYRGKLADIKQERGVPIDKNDHQPENLRRLLMKDFKFVDYRGEVIRIQRDAREEVIESQKDVGL